LIFKETKRLIPAVLPIEPEEKLLRLVDAEMRPSHIA
jgi:hypothetical protein